MFPTVPANVSCTSAYMTTYGFNSLTPSCWLNYTNANNSTLYWSVIVNNTVTLKSTYIITVKLLLFNNFILD